MTLLTRLRRSHGENLILALVAWSSATGCVTLENSARLRARPDFPAAAMAAPEWVRDALKTINALEYRLEGGKP